VKGLGIVFGLAVATFACAPTPASGTAAPTPTHAPTPTTTASPAAVLDDRFGFLVSDASIGPTAVRLETDPRPAFTVIGGMPSPDGRRLAHSTSNGGGLDVVDVAPGARPRTLLTPANSPLNKEYGSGVVWSSDSTGLVIGVTAPSNIPAADAPPEYSAIRLLDVAGGQPREIARIRGAMVVPLAWDRKARLIAAYEAYGAGIGYYDLITEDGKVDRAQILPPVPELQASTDAQQIFARDFFGTALRVWPLGAIARSVDLKSAAGERILAASWRPGSAEIGVLLEDRLELWDPGGGRRPVPLPRLPPTSNPNRDLFFRADGSAVFVVLVLDPSPGAQPDVYCVAVELQSGRSAVVPTRGVPPNASVRVGP
jgi:hypothetical protein